MPPCVLGADWCLRSDVVTNSGLQDPNHDGMIELADFTRGLQYKHSRAGGMLDFGLILTISPVLLSSTVFAIR